MESINSPELSATMSHLGTSGGLNNQNALAEAAASIGFSTTPSLPIFSNSHNGGASGSLGHLSTNNTNNSPLYTNNSMIQYGNTPPIPESTSPFDDFMLSRNVKQPQPVSTTPQQAMWSQKRQQQLQQQQQQLQSSGSAKTAAGGSNIYSPSQVSSQYGMTQISSPPPRSGSADLRSTFSPPHALRFLQDNGIPTVSSPGSPGSLDTYGHSPSSKGISKLSSSLSHSMDDKQQQLLAERRRRRRESHNAVERRRRDNINEKIQELATLVPDSLLYSMDSTDSPGAALPANLTKDGKPNKGTILSRSVDYIRHLQIVIDDQNRRELEMQDAIQGYQRQLGMEVTEFKHTSAELALAKFRGGGYSDLDLNDDLPVLSPDSQGSSSNVLNHVSGFSPDNDIYSPNS